MKNLDTVGVIGAGTMGSGIGLVAAIAGHKTIVFDADAKALAKAKESTDKIIVKQIEKGTLTSEKAQEIKSNLTFADTINALGSCELVIEAIIENLNIKQNLFVNLESIVSDSCILATNTSSLSIVSIASACENPGRVIGIHFFNPANVMPLVEIIPSLTTDDKITKETIAIIDSWGKKTVLAKDTPGFIVNRIARPYYGEAIRIYEESIADLATIDWAMKEVGKFRMGPFELMDFIGNDINYKVTETVFEQFFYDPRYKPSFTQKRLYEAKHFGRKSGKGYYDYSPAAKMPEPIKDSKLSCVIFNRIIAMLINEAADALYLKIATREDIDLAMTKGVNYPKGLLKWADELGINYVLNALECLHSEYGEDRYRPSVLLKRMVHEGKTFY